MPRLALEVADIFRQHGAAYREAHQLSFEQLRVMRAIEVCLTLWRREKQALSWISWQVDIPLTQQAPTACGEGLTVISAL
jgi:hypothetical protein